MDFLRRIRSKSHLRAVLLTTFTIASFAQAQFMTFVPVMPTVITNIGPSDLAVFTSTGLSGNQVFVVGVSNAGNTVAVANLRLHYRVTLRTSGSSTVQPVYECLSNVFQLDPGENLPSISSSDFFNHTPGLKVYKQVVLFEMLNSQILETVASAQRVPDGEIVQEMTLEQNGSPIAGPYSTNHTIINATSIDLISPGSEGSDLPVIFDPNPAFMWTSDLPAHVYGNGSVFEVQLFEAYGAEPAGEVVSRVPIFTFRTTVPGVRYPSTAKPLDPGKRYFWRVVGFLKGFTNASLSSSSFGFFFEEQMDPDVAEVLKILSLVCTPEELAVVRMFRSSVSLKGDIGSMSVDELRTLVNKIVASQYERRGVVTQ